MVYRFYCMALFHSQTRRHMIIYYLSALSGFFSVSALFDCHNSWCLFRESEVLVTSESEHNSGNLERHGKMRYLKQLKHIRRRYKLMLVTCLLSMWPWDQSSLLVFYKIYCGYCGQYIIKVLDYCTHIVSSLVLAM